MPATAIGAHVSGRAPLAAAQERGADLIQVFLGEPQSWKKPPPRPDVGELAASDIP
ncbi:MAG: deoxyribonuclease IV, partial [Acidimicrobiia bacterium]|nr:deoxyribonuclease IV [Acidimicrobiia bacterium]